MLPPVFEVAGGNLGGRLRRLQHERFTVRANELILQGVEVEPPRESERRDYFRAGEEVHGGAPPIVAAGEVAVVGGDDGVGRVRSNSLSAPLTDAGSAGVGEHRGTDLLEGFQLTVALDRRADLLGARRHEVWDGGLPPMQACLFGHVGRTAHILVGGVGATADECSRDAAWESGLGVGDLGSELREGPHAIGRVGARDVRLQG